MLAGLGTGCVAALVLDQLLPSATGSGLRGTLVLLPIIAAILGLLARSLGAPCWPHEERVGAGLALALALGQDRLGFPASEGLATLGLFGLVALRILRLAPALQRALAGRRAGWRLALAAAPLAAYLVILPWADAARAPNGDEPYYLLLAESLASDFDVDLADEYRGESWRALGERRIEPQPGDPTGPAGELYSRHEPFLPLLLAPFWAIGGVAGARFAMLLASAALAAATAFACLAAGARPRGAFRAWALAAFAPPVLLLSHQVWVEIPAALLVAISLGALGRVRTAKGQWTRADALAFALPLALLPLLKLRLLAVAVPLALAAIAGPKARRGLRLAAGAAVVGVGLAILALNAAVWGNPLRMHSLGDLALFEIPLERFLRGGVGLGFDTAFGLFACAPLWLLVLPGLARAVRERGTTVLACAALVPYLVLVATRREWYGGWSPPFRYGVVVLPVLAAAVALAAGRRASGGERVLVALLASATVVRTAAVLVEPGWAFNLAHGRAALVDVVGAGFAADLSRFLPSAVRPRAATWIVPIVAVVALIVARRLPWRPRAPASAGVAGLLLGWTLLLLAAHRLPTRVAEVEDPWVTKSAGGMYPGHWTMDRTRFPEGWNLPAGGLARITPIVGGREVEIEIHWASFRRQAPSVVLEVWSGGQRLRKFGSRPFGTWQSARLPAVPWAEGGELELRCPPLGAPGSGGVVLDRVEFHWR